MLIAKSANISQCSRPFPSEHAKKIFISLKQPLEVADMLRALQAKDVAYTTASGFALNSSSQLIGLSGLKMFFFYFQKIFPVELKMHSFSKPYGQLPESVNVSVLTLDLSNSNGFYIWFRILHV